MRAVAAGREAAAKAAGVAVAGRRQPRARGGTELLSAVSCGAEAELKGVGWRGVVKGVGWRRRRLQGSAEAEPVPP